MLSENNDTFSKEFSSDEEFMDGFAWEKRDKRLDGLPMMGSIWHVVYLNIAYLLAVKMVGPKFMENRQPISSTILVFYNGFQFLSRLAILTRALYYFAKYDDLGFGEWLCMHLMHCAKFAESNA